MPRFNHMTLKGYVVRCGTESEGYLFATGKYGDLATRPRATEYGTIEEAVRVACWTRMADAVIVAVAEDGTETRLPTYGEALARLEAIQLALEGAFAILPKNNNQPRVVIRGAGVELIRHRRSLAEMRLPENVADANAILFDALRALKQALSEEPFHAHRMGRDLQTIPDAWRLDVVPEIQDEVDAHRETKRSLAEAEQIIGSLETETTELCSQLEAVKADLTASAAMVQNLLDPEFRFTRAGMEAVDARGIIQAMVESFDAMMQKSGAQNFMTYEIQRGSDPTPAYVVTVQKATGQTPAERYMEVARELRELKAKACQACKSIQEREFHALYDSMGDRDATEMASKLRCPEHSAPIVAPQEEEPKPREPGPDDHVTVDTVGSALCCGHCGKSQTFGQPIAGNDLKALMESFGARHRLCPKPAER